MKVTLKLIRIYKSRVGAEFRDGSGNTVEHFQSLTTENLKAGTHQRTLASMTGIPLDEISRLVESLRDKNKSPDGTLPSVSRVFEWTDLNSRCAYKLSTGSGTVAGKTPKEALTKAVEGKCSSLTAADQTAFSFVTVEDVDSSTPVTRERLLSVLSKTVAHPLYYTISQSGVKLLFCECESIPAYEVASAFCLLTNVVDPALSLSTSNTIEVSSDAEFHLLPTRADRETVRGYFGFEEDTEAECPSVLLTGLVRGKTHWPNQGEYTLRSECLHLPTPTLKAGYHGLIGLAHGKDSYAYENILKTGQELVRTKEGYSSPQDLTTHRSCSRMVKELPAVRDDQGDIDYSLVELHTGSTDLGHRGYFTLTPIRGKSAFSIHQRRRNGLIPYPTYDTLYSLDAAKFRPKYLPPSKRLPIDEAYGLLTESFPGLNRNLLELILVQRGVTDGNLDERILLFVYGPTGSQKTTLFKIAASIDGDVYSEVTFKNNTDRAYMETVDVMARGNYVQYAEFFKAARRGHIRIQDAVNFFLNLTPDAMVWKNYTGGRPLGRLPSVSISDTELPEEVRDDAQIARRSIAVELPIPVPKEWRDTCRETGVTDGDARKYRVSSPQKALICDSILSHVADKYFKVVRPWENVVRHLGFRMMSDEISERPITFFHECLKLPDATESQREEIGCTQVDHSPGWKLIRRSDRTLAASMWTRLSDIQNAGKWVSSTKMKAFNWTALLGDSLKSCGVYEGDVVIDTTTGENAVLVKFSVINNGVKIPLVNLPE